MAVLWEWVAGAKPTASEDTYRLLGGVAGQIHTAADSFASAWPRAAYDAEALIVEQLCRMRPALLAADRWPTTVALGERLSGRIADPALDRGICHVDLTLDNVHRDGDTITAFDFDSAGPSWRAHEPYGVLRAADVSFRAWVEGYRTVRRFSQADEHAVTAFAVIGDLRNVAWQLGLAESSRGKPLLCPADLPGVVGGWLEWEAARLV